MRDPELEDDNYEEEIWDSADELYETKRDLDLLDKAEREQELIEQRKQSNA